MIHGTGTLSGGKADSFSDHRVAMSAAVAACICENEVTVTEPYCTAKSYPAFWEDLDSLEVSY